MKKLLLILMAITATLCFIWGCGKKDTNEGADKVPAETKQAEMADSTAMDSATWEEDAVDTTAGAHDSL